VSRKHKRQVGPSDATGAQGDDALAGSGYVLLTGLRTADGVLYFAGHAANEKDYFGRTDSPTGAGNMLIAICRASTTQQGVSVELQKKAIAKWAKQTGTEVFIHDSYCALESGASVGRASVEAALDAIKHKEATGIIVTKLDRLSRTVSEVCRISDELDRLGGVLVVTEQQIDTSTAMGKFFFHVMASFAELEREMIRERCAVGKAAATARGEVSVASYGYRKVNKLPVPHPKEQWVLQEARRLRAEDNLSWYCTFTVLKGTMPPGVRLPSDLNHLRQIMLARFPDDESIRGEKHSVGGKIPPAVKAQVLAITENRRATLAKEHADWFTDSEKEQEEDVA